MMRTNMGWCKIHNAIYEHKVFENKDHFALFCWLIGHASFGTHSEKIEGKVIKVYPGELYTTREKIAEGNKIGLRSVHRYLEALTNDYDNLITKENYDWTTLKIVITNYKKYQ